MCVRLMTAGAGGPSVPAPGRRAPFDRDTADRALSSHRTRSFGRRTSRLGIKHHARDLALCQAAPILLDILVDDGLIKFQHHALALDKARIFDAYFLTRRNNCIRK